MPERKPALWVVAGPNGAGKSSIVGEMIRESGGQYFNPDEVARRLCGLDARLSQDSANAMAWRQGKNLLESAIEQGRDFAFETTLGGHTIPGLIHHAADRGFSVKMWFLALESAELHLVRVKERVRGGGHDIPEEAVRERYVRSRHNLIQLIPRLAALKVYDNSETVGASARARPRLVLDWKDGRVLNGENLSDTPAWARAIVAAALKAQKLRT